MPGQRHGAFPVGASWGTFHTPTHPLPPWDEDALQGVRLQEGLGQGAGGDGKGCLFSVLWLPSLPPPSALLFVTFPLLRWLHFHFLWLVVYGFSPCLFFIYFVFSAVLSATFMPFTFLFSLDLFIFLFWDYPGGLLSVLFSSFIPWPFPSHCLSLGAELLVLALGSTTF